jgi:two-component sensor histidine kinase
MERADSCRNGFRRESLPALEGQPMASITAPHVEAASTLAVIASSNEPLLFLGADLTVIAASASFCRVFQIDPTSVPGRQLSDFGAGEWALPQLSSLLRATASGSAQIEAYEIDLVRKGHGPRRLVLNARKLEDGDEVRVRLLLAITDVTLARAEARQKDDLIREKAILLQEVRHRVANSLQIIASVLLQSARNVQSEEASGHLRDAHYRVMSIAAVQRRLAASTLEDVALRPYFVQLCGSLGASMIRDPERLSIAVTLVINALKHAFPEPKHGKIVVDYRSEGQKWTLSVKDDGVGMPMGEIKAKPGLGTGIVEALAKQLRGYIRVADASPGTAFTLVHDETAGNDSPSVVAA